MVSTKQAFSSLDMSKGQSIVLGDDSLTESKGKGRIELDHGNFKNVLYVPGLASNLLSVYQMTPLGLLRKSYSHQMKLRSQKSQVEELLQKE